MHKEAPARRKGGRKWPKVAESGRRWPKVAEGRRKGGEAMLQRDHDKPLRGMSRGQFFEANTCRMISK